MRWTSGGVTGVLTIRNPDAALQYAGLDADQLLSYPTSFWDDGELILPWTGTLAVARSIAPKVADAILQTVAEDEAKMAERAIHGEYFEWGRGKTTYIKPDKCVESDKFYVSAHEILREWCGGTAVERQDELEKVAG